MLHYAVVFFVIALIAAVLGFGMGSGPGDNLSRRLTLCCPNWRPNPLWNPPTGGQHRVFAQFPLSISDRPAALPCDLSLSRCQA